MQSTFSKNISQNSWSSKTLAPGCVGPGSREQRCGCDPTSMGIWHGQQPRVGRGYAIPCRRVAALRAPWPHSRRRRHAPWQRHLRSLPHPPLQVSIENFMFLNLGYYEILTPEFFDIIHPRKPCACVHRHHNLNIYNEWEAFKAACQFSTCLILMLWCLFASGLRRRISTTPTSCTGSRPSGWPTYVWTAYCSVRTGTWGGWRSSCRRITWWPKLRDGSREVTRGSTICGMKKQGCTNARTRSPGSLQTPQSRRPFSPFSQVNTFECQDALSTRVSGGPSQHRSDTWEESGEWGVSFVWFLHGYWKRGDWSILCGLLVAVQGWRPRIKLPSLWRIWRDGLRTPSTGCQAWTPKILDSRHYDTGVAQCGSSSTGWSPTASVTTGTNQLHFDTTISQQTPNTSTLLNLLAWGPLRCVAVCVISN